MNDPPNHRLMFTLDSGPDDFLGLIGAAFLLAGTFGSVACYSIYWVERFAHATELMTILSVVALAGLGLVSRPWVLILDREQQTITRKSGPFFSTEAIRSIRQVALYHERIYKGHGIQAPAYHVVVEAVPSIPIRTFSSLLPARELGREVAGFLAVPFEDQTKELTENLLLRDTLEKYGKGRRTLRQFAPQRIQLSLKAALILMLCASLIVGIAVYVSKFDKLYAPLLTPAGFLIMGVLVYSLADRRAPPTPSARPYLRSTSQTVASNGALVGPRTGPEARGAIVGA